MPRSRPPTRATESILKFREFWFVRRDPRHHDVQRLTRRTIRNRRFTDWSMKFVAIERLVSQVLRRHDLEAFDPYRFTPALIDDLVISCIAGPDSVPDAEQQIAEPARRPPLWRRLLGWY
ncbi:MAG: BLUF domain-containing protein [Xanthomonadaceae bacterium]|nr:BLUF domain-containing protein [Xanthomonadaceae bacterium]